MKETEFITRYFIIYNIKRNYRYSKYSKFIYSKCDE